MLHPLRREHRSGVLRWPEEKWPLLMAPGCRPGKEPDAGRGEGKAQNAARCCVNGKGGKP